MLSITDVSFRFAERTVLHHVSLEVGRGELVCVVGPNGAGKTTLLRIAAGLLPPSEGAVRIAGEDPARMPRRLLARRAAYLPQDYAMVFPFTVAEIVLMGRYPHRGPFALESDDDTRLAAAAMARCDVAWLAERRFDALSGGERRRTLLAQAFCQATDLLLLDEPTASLDPAHAEGIFRILAEEGRSRGAAALVVTHDLNLAARFADRVVLLDRGALAAGGPPSEVLGSAAAARAYGIPLHVGTVEGVRFVVPLRMPEDPPE
jgi:iron complex transport system ATP-binding protein